MFRLVALLSLIALVPTALVAQEWLEVSPESAASHLLKKVEPVYPAFAEAAGVEGAVQIRVGIYKDGRIHAVEERSGPPSLFKAAEDAVLQYVYRPFEESGHAVNAQTTVEVVFKLGKGKESSHPHIAPALSRASFSWVELAQSAAEVPSALRKWLASDLQKILDRQACTDSDSISAQIALREMKSLLPDAIRIIAVPVANPGVHLYLVSPRIGCLCGGTGNCPIELVEENVRENDSENGSGFRSVAATDGTGFYVYPGSGSPYPDIFIASHSSATKIGVVGYSNAAGEWGELYCGEIVLDPDHGERDNIQVCH